jgi:hypothetical protein
MLELKDALTLEPAVNGQHVDGHCQNTWERAGTQQAQAVGAHRRQMNAHSLH